MGITWARQKNVSNAVAKHDTRIPRKCPLSTYSLLFEVLMSFLKSIEMMTRLRCMTTHFVLLFLIHLAYSFHWTIYVTRDRRWEQGNLLYSILAQTTSRENESSQCTDVSLFIVDVVINPLRTAVELIKKSCELNSSISTRRPVEIRHLDVATNSLRNGKISNCHYQMQAI